jgi:hypothetical protein
MLKNSKYIGIYRTSASYQMICMKKYNFPFIIDEKIFEDSNMSEIIGEVYDIDDDTFSIINNFTGATQFYNLITICVRDINNINLFVNTYLLDNMAIINDARLNKYLDYIHIVDGNWINYLE